MNEKRLCELLLPCYLIFNHIRDEVAENRASRAMVNYLGKHLLIFCENDKEKAAKISKRAAKQVHEINYFIADNNLVKGVKLVLITHFLTQLIFDEKDALPEKYWKVADKTKRLIEFTIKILLREVSEDDLEKLIPSAKKQAAKVYEKFYKNI